MQYFILCYLCFGFCQHLIDSHIENEYKPDMKDDFLDSPWAPAQGLFLLNGSYLVAPRDNCDYLQSKRCFRQKKLLQGSSFTSICPAWYLLYLKLQYLNFSSDDKPQDKPAGVGVVICFSLWGSSILKPLRIAGRMTEWLNACQQFYLKWLILSLGYRENEPLPKPLGQRGSAKRHLTAASGCNQHRQPSVAGGQRWMGKRRSPAVWKMLPSRQMLGCICSDNSSLIWNEWQLATESCNWRTALLPGNLINAAQ